MKKNLSRMLRSTLALLLVFALVVGYVPTTVFASSDGGEDSGKTPEPNEINYVSIGDSMTNGYCFDGYEQGKWDGEYKETYNFLAGEKNSVCIKINK